MQLRRSARILVTILAAASFGGCGSDDGGGGGGGVGHTVVSANSDVAGAVTEYRALLGEPNNGGAPGIHVGGRREINWDAVGDDNSSPHFLPGDFFNAAVAPRARGAEFSTPGVGVQVSADSDNPDDAAVRFGNINATYTNAFQTFSAERLFSPIGSNLVDVTFFIPGTASPAVTTGFGAVYTDVDGGGSSFEYFDADGDSLGQFDVPEANNALSFLGVVFDEPVVARVRIKYGNTPLGPDESEEVDVAVMDDFLYGEPRLIPVD